MKSAPLTYALLAMGISILGMTSRLPYTRIRRHGRNLRSAMQVHRQFHKAMAGIIVSATLTACGGGGGNTGGTAPGPAAPSTTIGGVVSKGLIAGATVTAYCGGQSSGTVFGTPATTDSNGAYDISSTSSCAQPIELVATGSTGSTELDEISSESVAMNFTLKAYIATPENANTQHITPLTDIVATVIDGTAGGLPTSASVESVTNALVTNVLGGDAATYSAIPMPATKALASNNQAEERLASILTSISAQANWLVAYAPRIAGHSNIDLAQATTQVIQDLEDAATGSSGSGTSAPDWSAVTVMLETGLAKFWYGRSALDTGTAQLERLPQSTPQFTTMAGASTYTLGGTVAGITGAGLILQSNLGEDLPVSTSGVFTFVDPVSTGATYAVRVAVQPSGQTCSVANGFGSVTNTSITSVVVTCVPAYTLGGSVAGLDAGASVTLAELDGDTVSISADGVFSFPTALAKGSPYAVTVASQPTGERCTINAPSGVVPTSNISNLLVSCADVFQVAVDVNGLESSGNISLTLTGAGLQQSVSATQDGVVTFPLGLTSGTSFRIVVSSFPAGQGCTFSGGSEASGTVVGSTFVVNPVQLECTSGYFTIGGSVAGLAPGSTLILTDTTPLAANGTETLAISANGIYTFVTPVAGTTVTSGAPPTYQVTFTQQPPDQNCTWAYGAGVYSAGSYPLPANVTQLNIVCTAAYVLSGSVNTSAGISLPTGTITVTGTSPFPGSSSDSKTTYLNSDGTFSLPVPPGTYTVTPYTAGGQIVFNPPSQSVVVGSSAPPSISFTCVSGCPVDSTTGGGTIGTSTGGTGSGGSSGSGGGASGSGGGTVSCNFSSCATPLPATCVSVFKDPSFYDWYSFENTCGEPIDVTFSVPDSAWGGLFAMDLNPGQSNNTGLGATDAPHGFLLAVCPYGYHAWSATSNGEWNGVGAFICVPAE